jgi:hypothetical protein
MKTLSSLLLSILLLGFSTVSQAAAYDTDPQAQYPKDQTQDTFSFASQIACIIRGMAPEKNVGIGQYLAFVDEAKCNDSGGGAGGSSSTGASTAVQTNFSKALVTVEQGSAGELKVDVLFKAFDEENNVKKPKDIQVLITIFGGVNVAPPYGRWTMDYCSSTAGLAGTCDDGTGYLRVNSDGLVVFNNWSYGYRAGRSVFSDGSGNNGYGTLFSKSDRWPQDNANALFAFAPGKYILQDRKENQNICYNPSVMAPGVRYSTWENYLYHRTSKERLAYKNPGFYLKSNFSEKTVGAVSYYGVNFWNDADESDQLDGATLRNASDLTQTYTLRKSPGRLEKVTTSVSNGLDNLVDIPLNLGVWGYVNSTNTSIDNEKLINGYGSQAGIKPGTVIAEGAGVNLIASWDGQKFVFSGYRECNSAGCRTFAFEGAMPTRNLSELVAFGVRNMNAWVDGLNTNYNFQIADGSGVAVSSIKLAKQFRNVVAPNDSTIPSELVCVGRCPSVGGNGLIDEEQLQQNASRALAWSTTTKSPTVTGSSNNQVAVDWSNKNLGGKYYQLFKASDLPLMLCDPNNINSGYCSHRLTNQAESSYFTWQTGNRWDAYIYLEYRNGTNAGKAVAPNPPLLLSYTVPNTRGNTEGYIGKTITAQSPQPGSIWLPGSCIDNLGKRVECSSSTSWVNDVSIPTASDDTGMVTLLSANGNPTSTKYLVKWLKRGVYFESINSSECTPLSPGLTQAAGLELPGISDYNASVKTLGLPWPTTPFDGKPRVIDGELQ